MNPWNHIDSLWTDGAPSVLREVRFFNSGEETGTAHHFCRNSAPCVLHLGMHWWEKPFQNIWK